MTDSNSFKPDEENKSLSQSVHENVSPDQLPQNLATEEKLITNEIDTIPKIGEPNVCTEIPPPNLFNKNSDSIDKKDESSIEKDKEEEDTISVSQENLLGIIAPIEHPQECIRQPNNLIDELSTKLQQRRILQNDLNLNQGEGQSTVTEQSILLRKEEPSSSRQTSHQILAEGRHKALISAFNLDGNAQEFNTNDAHSCVFNVGFPSQELATQLDQKSGKMSLSSDPEAFVNDVRNTVQMKEEINSIDFFNITAVLQSRRGSPRRSYTISDLSSLEEIVTQIHEAKELDQACTSHDQSLTHHSFAEEAILSGDHTSVGIVAEEGQEQVGEFRTYRISEYDVPPNYSSIMNNSDNMSYRTYNENLPLSTILSRYGNPRPSVPFIFRVPPPTYAESEFVNIEIPSVPSIPSKLQYLGA